MTEPYGVGMTKAQIAPHTEDTEVEVSVTLIGDYYAMRVSVAVPGPIDEDEDEEETEDEEEDDDDEDGSSHGSGPVNQYIDFDYWDDIL